MKKFKFSLDTVMEYKDHVLDGLKKEHSLILSAIRAKEEEIALMEEECAGINRDYNDKKAEGMQVLDALSYEIHIRVLQKKIEDEYLQLEKLMEQAEKKKQEVIEARKEVASYEKLKEKHLDEYTKLEQKAEELFIDEFVSYKRSVSR